jgi:hypothetical protein
MLIWAFLFILAHSHILFYAAHGLTLDLRNSDAKKIKRANSQRMKA